MIEFEHVVYRVGERTILDDVHAVIPDGQFVAIVGHNGSGKTTLARHVNGLVLPSEGQVRVDGFGTSHREELWEARRRVGMVMQNPDHQMVASVVEEEVAFGSENLGESPECIRQRVDEALRLVHLQDRMHVSPHHLSGGQKQRLALACVMAMRPHWMVLDEPTSMLDPAGRREVTDFVLTLHRSEGLGLVWITHDMEEACLAERVLVMHQGRLVQDGPPGEVLSNTRHLETWGLHPPPAVGLAARLRARGVAVPAEVTTVAALVDFIVDRAQRKAGCPPASGSET